MKKLLYSLAAIAALVLAASCEREVAITGDNGDLVEATFRVAVPSTVATKAISDGTQATCLRFLAYDKDGNFLPNLKPVGSEDGFVTVSGYTAEVRAKLIKGVTYNFVFFAESAKDKYTIDGANKTIAIPDITAMMNDDSFDAFYARVENYLVKGAFSEDIQLTRPFAQVNFGALDGDLEAAEASNILTAADKMQTGYELIAPTTLGILSGEVSGAEATELTLAYRPAEQLKVGDTFYDYVAMAYILRPVPVYYDGANEMAFTGTDVKENIASPVVLNVATTQNDAALALEREVYNVPVQRNYRTNILGNIFSVEGVFNILVDNNWATGVTGADETYIPEYETIDALNTAFASDASDAAKWSYKVKLLAAGDVKEIKLPNTTDPIDIVFADGEWENENISVVYAAADALKPTKLTLKVDHLAGLTANLPQTTITVVEGSLIDEATITSAPHTFVIEKNAEVTNLIILGGGLKVEGTVGDAEVKPEKAPITDVVIADGAAVEGTLAVSGGEVTIEENAVVEKLVVEGTATAEVNTAATVGEIVADNPAAVTDENNDPVDDVVAAIKSGAALKAAFEAGGTVTVEGDITDGAGLFLAAADPKEVVLDLNGHTVEFVGPAVGSTGTQTQALHLEKGSTVTIKNGTLKLGASANGIKMFIQNYSELTLKDVIVDFTGSGYSYALSNNFGHITITGATEITVDSGKTAFDLWYGMASSYADGVYVTFDENFTGTVNGNIEYGAASWGRNQEGWQDKAVLTIKGEGTFNGSFAEGNTGGLVGANINIYSGKFSSDPSAFAAPGLTGQQGTDGWWTLVEKTTVAHADFAVPEAVTIYTSGLHQNVTLEPVVASDYAGELAYAITEGSDVITLSGAQIGHKDQTTGTAKVKVTAPADNKYDAAEATVTVTVKANLIESLTWATEPTAEQKTFTVGDDFVRGGTVTENFTDGDSAEAGFYGIEYSGYDMTTAGEQTVTVTSVADNKATGCNTLSYTIVVNEAPAQPDASPYTFYLTSGWENAEEVTEVLSPGKNVKLDFAQGEGSNSPKFYSSGTSVRTYTGNTLTITADEKYITKIEFTFDGNYSLANGTFSSGKVKEGVWFGTNEKSITITTVGSSKQIRYQSIKVTFGDEVGVLPEDEESSITIDDVEVEVEGNVTIAANTIYPATADFTLSSESDKISIDGKKITGVAEGTAEVTATVAAVEGSHKASSTTFTVTVTAKSTTQEPEPTYVWNETAIGNLKTGDVIVIAGGSSTFYALSNNNGTSSAPTATSIEIKDSKLKDAPNSELQWTVTVTDDGYKFGVSTNYLYCTNTNNGVRVGTNDNNVFVIKESYLYNSGTSRYIGVYNSSDWRCYTTINNNITGQSFKFFVKTQVTE